MTSASLSRRLALLATFATTLILASCGSGGSGSGSSNLRVMNLTGDLPSLDLYLGTTLQFGAQTTNTLSSNAVVDTNSYTVNVNSAGSTTTLFTGTYTLAKDSHYTAVVWGTQANLHVSTLPEDEDTTVIGTGNTRVRMFNATTETGPVDIYFTAVGADLTAATPSQSALASGTLAGFREIPAGTYQLAVTGVGKPDDVRLIVPSVTLGASQYNTLVITGGLGGVLVNGTVITQQSSAVTLLNTKARVRVIASVDSSGSVAVTAGTSVLSGGLVSNNSSYALVNAGVTPITVRVNGNLVVSGPLTFTAGNDYSMLVYGSPATAQLAVINDDNRLPLSTTRTKIRVINGVATLDALSLSVDNGGVSASSNVLPGTASSYSQVASNISAQIEVDSPTQGPVYITTRSLGDSLLGQGVYSVLVYSGKAGTASKLINERP